VVAAAVDGLVNKVILRIGGYPRTLLVFVAEMEAASAYDVWDRR
jgi:hypothetical protein